MPFVATPAVPLSGLTEQEFRVLSAIKENMDLLTGVSNDKDFKATLTGQFTVLTLESLNSSPVQTSGRAYDVGDGKLVPSLEDFNTLLTAVNAITQDVKNLQDILNALITQAKGKQI